MPILSGRLQAKNSEGKPVSPAILIRDVGLRVPVHVGIHTKLAIKLEGDGKPIVSPVSGQALIDTGATITSVDIKAAEKLGLKQLGIGS